MVESLTEQIMHKIESVAENYNRLLIVVARAGEGKTSALQEVQTRIGAPMLNINLELSRRMLDLTERQRALSIPRILGEVLNGTDGDVLLLDNIEILFDTSLKLDPLRLLQNLSRNKTLVTAWSGSIAGGHIVYAAPDHPEYKRYQVRDFLVASTQLSE